mgnify:FL=1
MKKLTIIIPLYNTNIKYLCECLNSCIDDIDIEVIVVDDGSLVDYSSAMSNYKFKYIKTENRGVSHARNLGIFLSKGEYVTFLDSDDLLFNIKNILNYLRTDDIILARNFKLKDTLQEDTNIIDSGMLYGDILNRDLFVLENRTISNVETVWAKFYKKEYLNNSGLRFDEKLRRGEDVLFNYEAYFRAESINYSGEYVYKYRINDDSVTRSFDNIMDTTTFLLLEKFEKLFKKLNVSDENYPNYVFRLLIRLIRKYYCNLSLEQYNSKIDLLFNNVLIDKYMDKIDITHADIYKKELYILLQLKDKLKLYEYMRSTVDKNKLKK